MSLAYKQELINHRQSIDETIDRLVSATEKIIEPLKELNEEQRDCVASLGLLVQAITLANRPPLKISANLLTRFKDQLDDFCHPLGTVVTIGDTCFEANVSYAAARKKCMQDNKPEGECFEALRYKGILTNCLTNKLESTKREIGILLVRQRLQKPIPWPLVK
ncbi:MAG: hypothetical protein E3J54_04940 [Actinobacteria bacterium]|nr:MAG: hypothetical protein E3J54_04940 [Actinomycetota bacterium]